MNLHITDNNQIWILQFQRFYKTGGIIALVPSVISILKHTDKQSFSRVSCSYHSIITTIRCWVIFDHKLVSPSCFGKAEVGEGRGWGETKQKALKIVASNLIIGNEVRRRL